MFLFLNRLLPLFILFCTCANAGDLRVSTFSDEYDGVCNSHCSLRDAISQANDTPGKDTIHLRVGRYRIEINNLDDDGQSVPENQNLQGDFDILDSVEIIGKGKTLTIIDGNRIDGIFNTLAGDTVISDLTITNGYSFEGGAGGITNATGLTIKRVLISENEKESECSAQGGAIYNNGSLRIFSSTVKDNLAKDYCELTKGGGLFNRGELMVRDSFFSGNVVDSHELSGKGGAIYNEGTADIRRSAFYQNKVQAAGQGGAIFNTGTLKLVSSTAYDNESGRALPGGAIANGYYSSGDNEVNGGKLRLTNVTIYGNKNYGLYSNGDTIVRNSIIIGNYFFDGDDYFTDQWMQDCYSSGGNFVSNNNIYSKDSSRNCGKGGGLLASEIFTYLFDFPVVNGNTVYLPLKHFAIIRSEAEVCPQYDQLGNETMYDGACDLGAIQYVEP